MDAALNDMIAWMPGPWEMIVIALFGLLLFGKRLPEVGKSLGKSIVEFKKGLKGIEDDVEDSVNRSQKDMLPPPSPTGSNTTTSQQSESKVENPYSQQSESTVENPYSHRG